jgi:hypothetical protein
MVIQDWRSKSIPAKIVAYIRRFQNAMVPEPARIDLFKNKKGRVIDPAASTQISDPARQCLMCL